MKIYLRNLATLIVFFCSSLTFAFAVNAPTAPTSDDQSSLDTTASQANSDDDKSWEYAQSIKYSRGKYGTGQESETYEEDAVVQKNFENAALSITIPSLWQTGNVAVTNNGREIINRNVTTNYGTKTINPPVTGLGDIAFNGSYFLLKENKNGPLDVTLTSYLKTPTASVKNGLGTGEWAGGPGIGFAKKIFGNLKAVADASYIFDGKIPGEKTYNQTSLDGGLEYDLGSKAIASVKYEWMTAATAGTSVSKDIALGLDYKINDDWKINGEAAFGLSNGAPEQAYLLGATLSFSGDILGISKSTSRPNLPETDPLFRPLQGQLYGSTDYSFGFYSSKLYSTSGTLYFTTKTSSNVISQITGYGISDRLSMTLIDSYEFNEATTTPATAGSKSDSDSRGLSNPTIQASYRLLNQSSFPADIDLSLSIAPNAFASKEAGNGQNGTIASGTQPVSFTTSIGRSMKPFSIQGDFTASYEGNRYYETLNNFNDYLDHEYFNYTFDLKSQIRVTNRFSINLKAGYTLAENHHNADLSTDTSLLETSTNTFEANAALNYAFIPNKLIGSLTYTYDYFSNSQVIYSSLTLDARNQYGNTFGATVSYLF